MNSVTSQSRVQTPFKISDPVSCEVLLFNYMERFKDRLLFANTDDELTALTDEMTAFLSDHKAAKQLYETVREAERNLVNSMLKFAQTNG